MFVVVGWKPLLVRGQVDIITTIAGVDTAGYCCDGEPATIAKLSYPYSICFDRYDNIYFSDAFNHRIRKIDHITGVITTVAGTGIHGYSGDSGLAINAQLYVPSGIIMDTGGNMYIADAGNMVVRKIDASTNIITTIAGNGTGGSAGDNGPATSAELNGPSGLGFDKLGNILIADSWNNKIRKLDVSTGVITTIAGTGTSGYSGDHGLALHAEFNEPGTISIDSTGNIIIADTYNSVVREVDVTTGIVTTIAGTGTTGFYGDNGLAVNAELFLPIGIYIDQQQNIFIADDENGAVRKIDHNTGIITTVAGTGVPGYSGDHGLATLAQVIPTDVRFNSVGDMIIADAGNNCIRRVYNPTAVKLTQNATSFNVYPNPSTGRITIQTSVSKQYTITVCNMLGEKVYQGEFNSVSGEVDLSGEACGMYFVYLVSGEARVVEKVVVER